MTISTSSSPTKPNQLELMSQIRTEGKVRTHPVHLMVTISSTICQHDQSFQLTTIVNSYHD